MKRKLLRAFTHHAMRLRRILALLETAGSLEDMNLAGLYLHESRGSKIRPVADAADCRSEAFKTCSSCLTEGNDAG